MSDGPGTVLITGASRGIGAATARLAARDGFDLALNYHSQLEQAETVADECRELGAAVELHRADVSSEDEVLAMYRSVDQTMAPLVALVNNAGILGRIDRFDTFDAVRLQRVVDVNVVGAMLCAREAIKRLSTRHGGSGGSIVNVGSAASRLGSPDEFVDYAATKGAIDSMTIGLAKELGGDAIRVNAVRPGLIETEIHASGGSPDRVARLAPNVPLARGGSADEVAETIVWLLSPAASYVSGALLDVAGGR